MGLLILTITLVAPIGSATTLHRHPLREGIATIAVKVNGISLRMLVDTGAQRSLSKGMNLSTPLNEEAALLPARVHSGMLPGRRPEILNFESSEVQTPTNARPINKG